MAWERKGSAGRLDKRYSAVVMDVSKIHMGSNKIIPSFLGPPYIIEENAGNYDLKYGIPLKLAKNCNLLL